MVLRRPYRCRTGDVPNAAVAGAVLVRAGGDRPPQSGLSIGVSVVCGQKRLRAALSARVKGHACHTTQQIVQLDAIAGLEV